MCHPANQRRLVTDELGLKQQMVFENGRGEDRLKAYYLTHHRRLPGVSLSAPWGCWSVWYRCLGVNAETTKREAEWWGVSVGNSSVRAEQDGMYLPPQHPTTVLHLQFQPRMETPQARGVLPTVQ